MTTTLVNVFVKAEFINAFIDATRENHNHSVQENGNFRFDILQDATNPGKFILYEVYQTEQEAAAHKETPHYQKWRDTVAPWMEKPREGLKHVLLFPVGNQSV